MSQLQVADNGYSSAMATCGAPAGTVAQLQTGFGSGPTEMMNFYNAGVWKDDDEKRRVSFHLMMPYVDKADINILVVNDGFELVMAMKVPDMMNDMYEFNKKLFNDGQGKAQYGRRDVRTVAMQDSMTQIKKKLGQSNGDMIFTQRIKLPFKCKMTKAEGRNPFTIKSLKTGFRIAIVELIEDDVASTVDSNGAFMYFSPNNFESPNVEEVSTKGAKQARDYHQDGKSCVTVGTLPDNQTYDNHSRRSRVPREIAAAHGDAMMESHSSSSSLESKKRKKARNTAYNRHTLVPVQEDEEYSTIINRSWANGLTTNNQTRNGGNGLGDATQAFLSANSAHSASSAHHVSQASTSFHSPNSQSSSSYSPNSNSSDNSGESASSFQVE